MRGRARPLRNATHVDACRRGRSAQGACRSGAKASDVAGSMLPASMSSAARAGRRQRISWRVSRHHRPGTHELRCVPSRKAPESGLLFSSCAGRRILRSGASRHKHLEIIMRTAFAALLAVLAGAAAVSAAVEPRQPLGFSAPPGVVPRHSRWCASRVRLNGNSCQPHTAKVARGRGVQVARQPCR